MDRYDAVVVGAGPNGLSAAVTLAMAGRSVLVVEAADHIGGGTRTEQLTLEGFHHDVCSAIHPFTEGSPFLRTLPLSDHGLRFAHPRHPLAHPVTPDEVAVLPRDLDEAVDRLGEAYGRTMRRIVRDWPAIERAVFRPLVRIPRPPVAMARFGVDAVLPATRTARRFDSVSTRALFGGVAAHAFLPLSHPLTSSFAWFLMAGAHLYGWPAAVGGSQSIADALASYLRSLGGEIRTGFPVTDLAELPPRDITMLDLSPEVFARLAGDRLPSSYLRRVDRFRRGPAAYKVDYALDGPVPWSHPDLAGAGTVHLSGTFDEVARAERQSWAGSHHPRPFVLVVQPSVFDETRAPAGKHTLWAYAHVPAGSTRQHADHIEARIEEFAPGFSARVLRRHISTPEDLERRNPNLVGGDVTGGAHTLRQLVFRPFPQLDPYATPLDNVFLCGASTPPGAGAHGMCGHNAALSALRR